MSRHGKSKGGRSHSGVPRKIAEPKISEPKISEPKISEPKPQRNVVAAEATGTLAREAVVRQAPSPALSDKPAPQLAKTRVAPAEPAALPPHELESAVASIERSFQAASQGTVEVNRMLFDIGRQTVASGLDLVRSLAAATSPVEVARLQLAFFDERMKALLHQAEELRALSADLVAKANEPLREHMRRDMAWWR